MADIFPADPNSPVGQVRLLIGDTVLDGGEYIFSDEFIGGYLTVNSNNVRYAAADALDVLATNEAYISKKLRSESIQTDGASIANAIRLHAAALRARAKQDAEALDAEGAVEIVDFRDPVSPWDDFEYTNAGVFPWR
jgi:hypothetical protein